MTMRIQKQSPHLLLTSSHLHKHHVRPVATVRHVVVRTIRLRGIRRIHIRTPRPLRTSGTRLRQVDFLRTVRSLTQAECVYLLSFPSGAIPHIRTPV